MCINFRHEKKQHPDFEPEFHSAVVTSYSTTKKCEDYLYNYHQAKLAYHLLLFEFEDAIKEADGDRVHNVYKFALLLSKCYGHHKYAYVTLLYLVKIQAGLGDSMKWNRFYNKYGWKGRNIPLHLKMEQLDKILKKLLRSLGSKL